MKTCQKSKHPRALYECITSVTFSPDNGGPPQSELISTNAQARDCPKRMGWTSENVAEEFHVTRQEQDAFAAESFQRAEAAEKNGLFAKEIVPFTVFRKDPSTGERKLVVVEKDDGIRYGTTTESLAKIKPAFPQWGLGATTGGNASQITDGAAATLLMTRRKAEELGLKILAKFVTTAVTGQSGTPVIHTQVILSTYEVSRRESWALAR